MSAQQPKFNNQMLIQGNPSTLKMHMTGMENFQAGQKRGIPVNATSDQSQSQVMGESRTISNNKQSMQAMLSQKNKNQPVQRAQPQLKSNQSASQGLDQKEKKIYEIYASSGKVMAPIGAQNMHQTQNQAFNQNKYQFATYYGQKPQQPSPGQGNPHSS